MPGIQLIQRNGVFIRSVTLGICPGQILVCIGVAVNATHCRMRKAGINGDIAPQGLENIENLGQPKILFPAMRKPAPVLPRRILPEGNAHSIGMVDTDKALWDTAGFSTFPREGLQPRQGQCNPCATQEFSTGNHFFTGPSHLAYLNSFYLLIRVKNTALDQ
jgi:hypothetical protein